MWHTGSDVVTVLARLGFVLVSIACRRSSVGDTGLESWIGVNSVVFVLIAPRINSRVFSNGYRLQVGGSTLHPQASNPPFPSLTPTPPRGGGELAYTYCSPNSVFGLSLMIFSYWGAVMLPSSFRFRSASISVDWSLWP